MQAHPGEHAVQLFPYGESHVAGHSEAQSWNTSFGPKHCSVEMKTKLDQVMFVSQSTNRYLLSHGILAAPANATIIATAVMISNFILKNDDLVDSIKLFIWFPDPRFLGT